MKKEHSHTDIIEQVPTNYYQWGVEHNVLQRLWHVNKLNAILGLIQSSPNKILDVGCASGWFLSRVAKTFPKAQCYGIDIYDKAVEYGKKLYPSISFQKADAHNMPFKASTFDLVICTEVLEHVNDPKSALLEIKRVLKKDGFAIIELDSGSILFSISWFLWQKFRGGVWTHAHIHAFTVKKLDRIINSCGFKILHKKKFNLGMAMAFLITK